MEKCEKICNVVSKRHMHSSFELRDPEEEEETVITGQNQGQSHHDYTDTCQVTLSVQEETDQKCPCTLILQN